MKNTVKKSNPENTVKKYYIPMPISREDALAMELDVSKICKVNIGPKTVSGMLIPATEEQYRAYMRDLEAEEKRNARAVKGYISNGKGKLIQCTGSCSKCEEHNCVGYPLSLDAFADANEMEFPDELAYSDVLVVNDILFCTLLRKLEAIDPELAVILKLMYLGLSQREITRRMGLKRQSTTEYKIDRMRTEAKRYVSRDDLMK